MNSPTELTNGRALSIAALCPSDLFDLPAGVRMRQSGSELTCYRSLPALLAASRTHRFDGVVVQDVQPQLRQWLAALRMELGLRIPVVVFGSGGADFLSRTLRGGADDYATYHDGAEALLQRVEARIEAGFWQDQTLLSAGGYLLHADRKTLADDHRETSLAGREIALACMLFENLGRTVSLNLLAGEGGAGRATAANAPSSNMSIDRAENSPCIPRTPPDYRRSRRFTASDIAHWFGA